MYDSLNVHCLQWIYVNACITIKVHERIARDSKCTIMYACYWCTGDCTGDIVESGSAVWTYTVALFTLVHFLMLNMHLKRALNTCIHALNISCWV